MYCRVCGAEVADGQKFCTKCGTKMVRPAQPGGQAQQPTGQQAWSSAPLQGNPQQPTGQQAWSSAPPQGNPQQTTGQQFQGNPQQTTGQQFTGNPQQPAKSSKTPLIIGIAAAAVVVIVVVILVVWKLSASEDTGTQGGTSDLRTAEPGGGGVLQLDPAPGEDAGDGQEDEELLRAAIEGVIAERGEIAGQEASMYFNRDSSFEVSGVLGAVIEDLDGNGSEEAIVVYVTEPTVNRVYSQVLADVYTVENGEAVMAIGGLTLANEIGMDIVDLNVYLKKTGDGYRLIGDNYNMYWHWADGGIWELHAYDCSDLSFSELADYYVAGSGLEESDERDHIEAAEAAGLEGVTEGLPWGPMLLQDGDIRMIGNIGTDIYDGVNYYDDDFEPTGELYGTMYFTSFTTEDYALDDGATADFLEQERERYSDTGMEDEYIFPNSDTEKLTKEDLKPIKNDADMLRKARNEIYARHGRKFQDPELQAYFESKSWYEPTIEAEDFTDDMLNDIERANCRLIKKYEDKLK